jgi:hypothetical protein
MFHRIRLALVIASPYRLVVLRDFGRPGIRFFTASRSLGSMSHSRPTFEARNRLLSMSARTLFALTPSLFAASVVPMIFMAGSIAPDKTME